MPRYTGKYIPIDTEELTSVVHPFMLDCLTKYSLEEMEEWLSPFITDERKGKIADVLQSRLTTLSVACESPTDIHNALAIVRTAEALAVPTMHVIDHELRKKEGRGTMQGANMWSHVHFHRELAQYRVAMQAGGIKVAAAVAEGGNTLSDIPLDEKVCFLFGNEMRGLTEEAVEFADYTFTLPMYGMTSSYNLSIAAALTLKEVTDRKRAMLNGASDITAKNLLYETVVSYVRTLGFDTSEKMLREMQCRAKN